MINDLKAGVEAQALNGAKSFFFCSGQLYFCCNWHLRKTFIIIEEKNNSQHLRLCGFF
jgi:hypothetical protein